MKLTEVQRDFSEFLASLNAARVKYLVVAAYALAAHGAPRNTLDLDVFVQPTTANGTRLISALTALGFGSLAVVPGTSPSPTEFSSWDAAPSNRHSHLDKRGVVARRLGGTSATPFGR